MNSDLNPSGAASLPEEGTAVRPGLIDKSLVMRLLPFIVMAAAVLVVPNFIFRPSSGGGNYHLTVLIYVGLNTILAVGLNLLMGYAGQVSLGHAAFYGIGAYTSAVLTTRMGVSPWIAIAAGVAVSCLIAYLLGAQALRLHGPYLAMATLGFGVIVSIVLLQWEVVTGGTSGIYGIPSLQAGKLSFDSDISMFYLVWGFATVVIALSANIVHSRIGRAFRAVHGSEVAASTLGVDTSRYKIQVFVLSAALASIAGSLYAHYVTFISPEPFGFKFSVELMVMVVVGGMASVWGAIFGAATITILGELLRGLGDVHIGATGASLSDLDVIVFGLILMVIMIYMPEGLTRSVVDAAKFSMRMARRRKAVSR